jgi:RDD family
VPRHSFVAGPEAHDWVTPEHLNVAPQLLGAPLARPRQRLLAISLDVLVVALLSNVGNLWLLAGLALPALMVLYRHDRRLDTRRRRIGWVLAVALMAIGAQQAWVALDERPLASRVHFNRTPADDDARDLAEVAGLVASAPGLSAKHTDAARIAMLEAQLAMARQPKPFDFKEQMSVWADEVGLGLGWAIAYFSLLPAWWNGQTLGKRLFGLRVVELTGKPLTVMIAFKRYGGYAAGMATGMFGFAQVFWDGNRQAIQDKTAHTVVIDLRRPPRAMPEAPAGDRTLSRPTPLPTDQEP